jgi:hypothetical protein
MLAPLEALTGILMGELSTELFRNLPRDRF